MRHLFVLSMFLFSSIGFSQFDHEHKALTSVLSKYMDSKGLVKYKQLKKDTKASKSHQFNKYLNSIAAVSVNTYGTWNKNQKMAFLINAYNAFTVKLIINNYPVDSIKDIGSLFKKPWRVEFFNLLGGKIKALDPIEHTYLRPMYKDYRIHAAVNCASISCPPLRNEAFVASKLNKQLDEQMTAWLVDTTRNQFSKKSIKISKIFSWYESDFAKWGKGVKNVLRRHLPDNLKGFVTEKIDIDYMGYSWDLNESK